MKKLLGTVYETDDFSIFKIITGNRTEIERRKQKIAKSVEDVGYIPAPIIVNEKMEIIDGQARYAYCKESETPIAYYVIEGLTIDDCIAMNISATNWGLKDYISSYADRGFLSYVFVEKFISNSPYGLDLSLWALAGTTSRNLSAKIKSGTLNITEDDYKKGIEIIDFWQQFDDVATNRKTEFLIALGYCYLIPVVNNDMLVKKIHQNSRGFSQIANVLDAIELIEDVYNTRIRNHVYIKTEYLKYLDNIWKGVERR